MGKLTALLAQRAQEAKVAEQRASAEDRAVRARFDEKLQLYLVLHTAGGLCATIFGVTLLPIWLLVGPFWAARYFKTIEARVTERSLEVRAGVWFRRETSVPLEKIQDLSLLHGPLLNALGLATLRIDTAGGAATPGASAAELIGIIDAARFRDEVLRRRDSLAAKAAHAAPAALTSADTSLAEIHDTLLRIEALLQRRAAAPLVDIVSADDLAATAPPGPAVATQAEDDTFPSAAALAAAVDDDTLPSPRRFEDDTRPSVVASAVRAEAETRPSGIAGTPPSEADTRPSVGALGVATDSGTFPAVAPRGPFSDGETLPVDPAEASPGRTSAR